MTEAEAGVGKEDDEGDQAEKGMKPPPAGEMTDAEPADALAQGEREAESGHPEQAVSADLLVELVAPEGVDLVPPRLHRLGHRDWRHGDGAEGDREGHGSGGDQEAKPDGGFPRGSLPAEFLHQGAAGPADGRAAGCLGKGFGAGVSLGDGCHQLALGDAQAVAHDAVVRPALDIRGVALRVEDTLELEVVLFLFADDGAVAVEPLDASGLGPWSDPKAATQFTLGPEDEEAVVLGVLELERVTLLERVADRDDIDAQHFQPGGKVELGECRQAFPGQPGGGVPRHLVARSGQPPGATVEEGTLADGENARVLGLEVAVHHDAPADTGGGALLPWRVHCTVRSRRR